MGLAGQIGAGAGDALSEILFQQLREAQLAEQQRQATATEGLRQQGLQQDQSQFDAVNARLTRAQDFEERQAGEAAEQESLDRMKAVDLATAKRLEGAAREQELADMEADPSLDPRMRRVLGVFRRTGERFTPEQLRTPDEVSADEEAANQRDIAKARAIAEATAPFRQTGGGGRGDMTPGQRFQATMGLRRMFNTETAAARALASSYDMIVSGMQAVRQDHRSAGAQTVLVAFQKLLDPNSVVRETEYARSEAGQSLANRLQGATEQMLKGGTSVTPEQLETYVALSKQFLDSALRSAGESKSQIEAIAREYGIDPGHVTRDLGGGSPNVTPPTPGQETGQPAANDAAASMPTRQVNGVTYYRRRGERGEGWYATPR